jgi:predicted enzyme related to lactoylglutathione lyase
MRYIVVLFFCLIPLLAVSQTSDDLAGKKRVSGIGGIFFKAKDAKALRTWYQQHLGIAIEEWGGIAFRWRGSDNDTTKFVGTTVWSIFDDSTKYFSPSNARFMINYRVDNLDFVLASLRQEGCNVEDKIDSSAFGKFGWLMDPEGNRIELWQPPRGQ